MLKYLPVYAVAGGLLLAMADTGAAQTSFLHPTKGEETANGLRSFNIVANGQHAILGQVFWFEHGQAAYITRHMHSSLFDQLEKNPAGFIPAVISGYFKTAAKPCLMVAANFVQGDYTNAKSLAPVGLSIENGRYVGGQFQTPRGAVMIYPDGRLEIFNTRGLTADALREKAATHGASIFQQIHAVEAGVPLASLQPGPEIQRRFLIKRISKTNASDVTFGVVHFSTPMTLTHAAKTIGEMDSATHKVSDAVYLDMGPNNLSWGMVLQADGRARIIGDTPNPDFRRYTNFLMFHCR